MKTPQTFTQIPEWPSEQPTVLRLRAAGLADGRGLSVAPGEILVRCEPILGSGGVPLGARRARMLVLAAGDGSAVASHPLAGSAMVVDLSRVVLIPGLVNAHTHLDLTHVGPHPFDPRAGFMGWIDLVRGRRATDPDQIRQSVQKGIELSLAAGIVAVGDIAGAPRAQPSLEPWEVLRTSPLTGVSFLEFFAIGKGEARGLHAARSALDRVGATSGRVRLGLQPHAPNTVSLDAYMKAREWAQLRGLPLATHLAETADELEFIARARGPQRELLERLDLWDDRVALQVGVGRSPVAHLEPVLRQAAFVLAHANTTSDEDIRILADSGQGVVYCPRASEYFGNPVLLGPHRYLDMLARGITVALGTDSIVNLPPGTDRGEGASFGVLDEMRLLAERDGAEPAMLLRMATVNGARLLGLTEDCFGLQAGCEPLGLVGVETGPLGPGIEPARAILRRGGAARPLIVGN